MNKLAFFKVMFLLVIASAKVEKIKIGDNQLNFYSYPALSLMLSKDCEELKRGKLCDFLAYLDSINVDDRIYSTNKGGGGINFGSRACSNKLKGTIFIGVNDNLDQITFCKIDDYYIDVASLSFYVEKNRGLIKPSKRRKR